jgi:hypothetical protein
MMMAKTVMAATKTIQKINLIKALPSKLSQKLNATTFFGLNFILRCFL